MEDLVERAKRGETRPWYRVPSKGNTDRSKTVAWAVDEDSWQFFRHSMKGTTTLRKLAMLNEWLEMAAHTGYDHDRAAIQVENYLGALVRGGQLVKMGDGEYEIMK